MKKIEIYAADYCWYCRSAVALLDEKGVIYTKIDVAADPAKRAEAKERSGRRTIPQIFIDGESVGGYDDIAALDARGALDEKLWGQDPPP